MRAVRLAEPMRIGLEEVGRPLPAEDEVLVRVEACGICGSDRHMYRGEYPTARPVTLGHEFSGIVVERGAAVAGIALGDRVSGDPNVSCGHCSYCRAGKPNLCATLRPIGVMRDGGFAEFVRVPASHAAVLPGGLDPLHGAFCEPVSCCLHALDIARIAPGMSVAIIGGGVIGLLMVQLARQAGAGKVVLSTRQAGRRRLALELGASLAIDPAAGDPVRQVRAALGDGAEVVIECAGTSETFVQAIGMARQGGTVVPFGVVPQGEMVSLSPFELLTKALRIEAAWLNPGTHGRAAALIAAGGLRLDPLITRTISLEEAAGAIAAGPAQGEIKLIAVP